MILNTNIYCSWLHIFHPPPPIPVLPPPPPPLPVLLLPPPLPVPPPPPSLPVYHHHQHYHRPTTTITSTTTTITSTTTTAATPQVNNCVSRRVTRSREPEDTGNTQMPEVRHSLTKSLYFFPGIYLRPPSSSPRT